MSRRTSIEVRGVVKRFARDFMEGGPAASWKSLLARAAGRGGRRDVITVLDGIDLAVQRGTTLALIGQNGCGKSTLLKIIAGIYRPDQGQVRVEGRLSSLIELGTGFHPEFTGRENVYLNGAILGLDKAEIAERFEAIAAYSGLGEYIDAPVKTYSSGMYVRLGFSVAVNVDPEVLLVDEVLAVGDEAFVRKCEDKIHQLRRAGVTICLVSHNLGLVERFADEVVWLDGGCLAARGQPRRVIDAYLEKVAASEDSIRRQSCAQADIDGQQRWGSGEVQITAVRTTDAGGGERAVFSTGEAMTVEMDYQADGAPRDLVFGVAIHNAAGVLCFGSNTKIDRAELPEFPSRGTVRLACSRLDLVPGTYFLDVAVVSTLDTPYDYRRRVASFAVRSPVADDGVYRPPHTWSLAARDEGGE